ncbi:hypothetical protein LHJ74_06855 [Streptomyces sp. N2-109]|uniref:Transposase n=1 Tax=Streptomyces gossypii TaxID=2883101 RepID=A0ABT2JQV2_9ACTN|nr:hypothetical protein [Streptomyces gossypii]MCT2589644.1 hypothetical protein [Streptomyces gossypii]
MACADGSYLSVIGTVKVRVIDAQIAVTCGDGRSFTDSYRLVTALTDAHRYPATVLVGLYHERWEHESAYYALRHTIMNGRDLRSGDPAGIEQEMWSLLSLYQAQRTVMVEAAESLPGTDPDRCCFSIALHTARDQVIQATGIATTDTDTLLGTIGRRILTGLLPPRRQRVSTRKVKSAMSATASDATTATPTPVVPLPASTSPSSNPQISRPRRPGSPGTTGLPPLPHGADIASWPCSRKTPRVSGDPAKSPPTSATSPWRPCADN